MEKLIDFFVKYKIELEKILIIFLFFSSIFVFFNYIFVFIAPFVIGYLIAIFLEPFVRIFINKFRVGRQTGALLSIFLMIIFIGGGLFLIISQFLEQLKILVAGDYTSYIIVIKQSVEKLIDIIPNIFFYIPEENMEMINKFLFSVLDVGVVFIGEQLKVIGISLVTFIPKFFVYLFIGVISSFFFIRDKENINSVYRKNMPKFIKKHIYNLKNGMAGAFLGYVKSQLIIMCFTAVISLFGLLVLQNEYALVLCVGISIADVLPVFGAGFVLWPLSLISFLMGDFTMGIGSLVIYIIVQITRQIIQPKILGSQIGLDPLLTLISIYIGIIVFGVLGIILGPMSVIVIKTIWESDVTI